MSSYKADALQKGGGFGSVLKGPIFGANLVTNRDQGGRVQKAILFVVVACGLALLLVGGQLWLGTSCL